MNKEICVCECVFGKRKKKMMPREQEAQWWLSNVLFLSLREDNPKKVLSFSKKKKSDFNPTI
jgi:predicted KAP-like P-loop ATPase